MQSKKSIITDSSNLKDLRNRNAYYIDKTLEVKNLFENSSNIILMPRPRRFGKTLFLSTMYYFFSNQEKDKALFENTAVYDTPFFKEHFGAYPVISLTFKDVRELNFDDMMDKIRYTIGLLVESLIKDIDLKKVDNSLDKTIITNIINKTASKTDYENSIKALATLLTNYYNKPCVILIDEYDTPIIQAYLSNYYEQAINFFRNILGSVFKGNELNIKKAVITGILRISKESMFSGLNNIKTFTILENDFSSTCGFTKEETIKLLQDYDITGEEKEKALLWYNSYNIGDKTITNPWSILNFVSDRKFEPYWANTASNDFIYELIQKSKDFRANLEKLLKNEPIDIKVNKNTTLRDSELHSKDNLFSFLFFSGYLKCSEKYFKNNKGKEYLYCKMIPTNIECQMIFETVISTYVRESFNNESIEELLKLLIDGNLEDFSYMFENILLEVSYHDLTSENSYHMLLLGILLNLSNSYEIISNDEAGLGRVDIVLLNKEDKNRLAVVMELKKIRRNETKDEALEKAIKQIVDKKYVALAKKRGYNNILAFGLVFDGKRCWVKEI